VTDLAMALSALAWLTARQGRETETLALIGEAETLMAEHGIPMAEVWSLSGRGELEMALGRTSAALSCQRRLEGVLRTLAIGDPDLSPAPDLIENLLRLGRADEARAAADSYARRAGDKGLPWVMARAQRALGLCAEDDRFDGHYAAALEAHALTPDRYEEARTRLAYGARLRRARRRVDSRDHLRAALEVFESLPSEPWADRAATELKATGEHVRRREQPHAAALTPQELQISLLLAEGRTTREVAAALFLSPKTVEYHLRKVYTKLGVRSRGELADLLPR
jgi:DNA-binding CsgD family transcriptional regulator